MASHLQQLEALCVGTTHSASQTLMHPSVRLATIILTTGLLLLLADQKNVLPLFLRAHDGESLNIGSQAHKDVDSHPSLVDTIDH